MEESTTPYRMLSGLCPDEQCQTKLFFPAYDASIECTTCGQRHGQAALKDVQEVTNPEVALHNILKNILLGTTKAKKGPETVKVLGLSNYQCKMISPLLTRYGMDKQGNAKLLRDMNKGDMFDCSVLGDRTFLIQPDMIEIPGYGRDRTGSVTYLHNTLEAMRKSNDGEERLLPIHADGDGHCLVHAVSKALIGRELFWHALRENLKWHLNENVITYQNLFADFIERSEWSEIIAECDPDYMPLNGESLGLRNIHIFALANILHRPILLLDSISGMQSSGDYSGVFLPALVPVEKCRSKEGELTKPLCLAWSSSGRNHYIAMVPIKDRKLPRIPGWMMPKVWGMPQELMHRYMDLSADGSCYVGGTRCLQDGYILKLVKSMEKVFEDEYQVHPSLVADVHQYVFKNTGMVGMKPELVIAETQRAVKDGSLFRCLTCDALALQTIDLDLLKPPGALYNLAVKTYGQLSPQKHYSFPTHGYVCSYNEHLDQLIPIKEKCQMPTCPSCRGSQMRRVLGSGVVQYKDGDRTRNRAPSSRCQCGFKHYWQGQEYDNLPETVPVSLEWNGKAVAEKVSWFQYETDPSMNSNVYEIAQKLVQKHFPGEFGSERLVQKVVDTILRQTAKKEAKEEKPAPPEADPLWNPQTASKIILTGAKKKTVHKEELTMSETEKNIKRQVEAKAVVNQRRRSNEIAQATSSPQRSPAKASPKLQKLTEEYAEKPETSTVSPSAAQTSSSPPKPDPPPNVKQKKVRVTTSDGRQSILVFTEDVSYKELQQRLMEEFGVPEARQKIRAGIPPKELKMAAEETVPLLNGDRIMLEIIPEPAGPSSRTSFSLGSRSSGIPPMRQSIPPPSATDQLLKGLQSLQQEGNDTIDVGIASLALMAGLTGKDLWTYVQSMPEVFNPGGLFYEQVKRDLAPLNDNKHCTLPSLDGKTFRYNATADRLELCLEPHGHFAVVPGIEEKVLGDAMEHTGQKLAQELQEELRRTLSSGATGVAVNKPMNIPQPPARPFSGQGHSLTSPTSTSDESTMETTSTASAAVPNTRLGPGFSVISHTKTNEANAAVDHMRNVAKRIEAVAMQVDEIPEQAHQTSPTPSTSSKLQPQSKDGQKDTNVCMKEHFAEDSAEIDNVTVSVCSEEPQIETPEVKVETVPVAESCDQSHDQTPDPVAEQSDDHKMET